MAKCTPEEKQKWHNIGEKSGAEGRVVFTGEPWCGPFESQEHYNGRREAFRKGYENGIKQKK